MTLAPPARLAPLALVVRSGFVEGVHHGSAVGVGPDGRVLFAIGDPDRPVLPRSALKPLQSVAMLRSGLMMDGEWLALSCASHSGEPPHLAGVTRMLASAGLTPADLGNTPDLPLGPAERLRWQRAGLAATREAMNCSGKHAAMLATCVVNDWPRAGYLDPGHPLQRAVSATVADLAGEPVAATAVDGCGAPALAIGLTALARAFGRIATGAPDTAEGRVAAAVRRHPDLLGGTGRDVTLLITSVPGLVAKDGAEAVYAAALPDGRAVAMKIADGSERARPVVMAALLRRLGVDPAALAGVVAPVVLGHGRPVGAIEPAAGVEGPVATAPA